MQVLSGNNLGQRHRNLNAKVAEAAHKKTNFDEVKSQEEKCDIDKIYKIDLASRYKNIDYILDVLKCGDVFYVTHALQCWWIYNDEYSDYINSNYLRNNIFPYMCMKMQKKTLTIISMYIRNGERAIDFYMYCREAKLNHYAYKFLVFTPDKFKLKLLIYKDNIVFHASPKYLKHFIGNSFELAHTYIALLYYDRKVIYRLRYLYTVSNELYLDMLENAELNYAKCPNCLSRLSIRISKNILKNHRSRVIKYPILYLNKLNKDMVIKYLTREDVLSLAYALLPSSSEKFWSMNFYHSYMFVLDKIPRNELFTLIKHKFNSKYGGEAFELSIEFYKLRYYEMLSIEEQEAWALTHIERDEELPGIENYIWYKFVSFKKAFTGIKRCIYLTLDGSKRSNIVNILPKTARSQDDLIEILNYYYQRHVNESEARKKSFINKVIEHHDIYSFESECWIAFDKLLYSLEVYTTYALEEYIAISMIYHILNNKILIEPLEDYINNASFSKISTIINELSEERNKIVAKFLMNYHAEKIKCLTAQCCNSAVTDQFPLTTSSSNDEIDQRVHKVRNVIHSFKRNHAECPEIVLKHMKLSTNRIDNCQYHGTLKPKFIKKTEGDFVRWLKQDMEMAIGAIHEIECNAYRREFRLCRLFKKLKVYFPTDVGTTYLNYFIEYLSHTPNGPRQYRNIKMAVVGVFYLADEDFKVTFMEKYVPKTTKIDHKKMDNRLLQIQKAICRLAYLSRPPVASIHKYITGDYVHYFFPVFINYFADLSSISKFVESIPDAPLSIQKHGLRLAFKSYSPEILRPKIIDAWQKTKNVSLRKLLYEMLFHRIKNESVEGQKELYDVLKMYTSELNHDDHEDIYLLLVSDDVPAEYKGDFIETAWLTVSQFSDKGINLNRKFCIIKHMEKYIHCVQREFPRIQIIDEHLRGMSNSKNINLVDKMTKAKWNLTAKYIVNLRNEQEQQRSIELMSYIIKNSLVQWDYIDENNYTYRTFIRNFISKIMRKEPKISERCMFMVPIYRNILDTFSKTLQEEEIYLLTWELKLLIASRKIIYKAIQDKTEKVSHTKFIEMLREFGQKIGSMVKRLIEMNDFYHCFYKSIADIISNIGSTICDFFSLDDYYLHYFTTDSLTDIKIIETHVLALLILPTDPPDDCHQEHSSVIKKIKEFDSKEIDSLLNKMYV